MFKNKNFLLMAVVVIFFFGCVGCGYKQLNIQKRDIAYLKFKKSMYKKYSVLVNKKYVFELGGCEYHGEEKNECQDPTSNKLYEVSSGKILIEVTDNSSGKLILRKELYLGSSNTTEIVLP